LYFCLSAHGRHHMTTEKFVTNDNPVGMAASIPASYAQWGEDLVVWEWLLGRRREGVFLEAGANHPTKLSQTFLLEQQGWHGILVEPVPACCALLRAQRPRSQVFQMAIGAPAQRGVLRFRIPGGVTALTEVLAPGDHAKPEDEVFEAEVRTLNDILELANVDRVDYLVLDTEGMELAAMNGFDFARYRPQVVLIEDRHDNLAKHRYLRTQGYRLVRRFGSNNCYVPQGMKVNVPWSEHWRLIRKVYLSAPFRKLRKASRQLRHT
jgi:FkbM family methyltransferase